MTDGLAYEGQIWMGETYLEGEMLQGTRCLMHNGQPTYQVHNPDTRQVETHKCCWCLGKGIIPSRKERRLNVGD